MKPQKLTIGFVGLSIILTTGCLNDQTSQSSSLSMVLKNNTTISQKVGALALNTSSVPFTFDDNTTTFTITEARMNIRDIRFDTSNSDTVAGTTHTVAGPYVMNLLDGTASPKNIVFDAPAGTYQRVDIRLDESNIEDAILTSTDELLTNALIIKGTHNYNGVSNGTFTLKVKVSEDIRFQPTNGIIVGTDTGANVVLNFSVTDWLENPTAPGTKIDLTSCIAANQLMDAQNHIALNEGTQCAGIAESIGNLIKSNMKNKYDFSAR